MSNLVDDFYKEKAALKNINEHYAAIRTHLIENGGSCQVVISADEQFHPNVSREEYNDMITRIFKTLQYGELHLSTYVKDSIRTNIENLRYRIKGDLEIRKEEKKDD